jgi:hypothetical protein
MFLEEIKQQQQLHSNNVHIFPMHSPLLLFNSLYTPCPYVILKTFNTEVTAKR